MNKPHISVVSVLWPLDEKLGLLKVRTERRFHKNIARVTEAIADEDSFLPPKAWLVPENDHLDSPDHVAVPEPSGLVLGGIGCAATLLGLRRRARRTI